MEVPDQVTGKKTDNQASQEFQNADAAKTHFMLAKDRLFNINAWSEVAGGQSAHFRLHDQNGSEVKRAPVKGDYIRIDIPGPGSTKGDGYDWVNILEVEEQATEDAALARITVRPADNPQSPDNDTAHFFGSDATSTFVVERKANLVVAEVHGRNEKSNKETSNTTDKIRNKVVAAGASVFSDIQWRALVKGLVSLPTS